MKNKLFITILVGLGILVLSGKEVFNLTQSLTTQDSDSLQHLSTQDFNEWKISDAPQRRPAECYDSGIC